MTTTDTSPTEVGDLAVPEYAVRVFAAELTPGDGRTVDLRIVPYGERAQANDGLADWVPRGVVYEEEILPGCFDHQLNAANRVHMNYEHQQGILGVVGSGVALRSQPDGLHGSFRFLNTNAGDTALELVRQGALGGVSFEAKFVKTIRSATGVAQRVKANLRNIALCREPAYSGAVVFGLRTEPEVVFDEQMLPLDFDPDLAQRIEALGLEVPDRLKMAHPASGTPAPSGTPADDTRHGDDNDDERNP